MPKTNNLLGDNLIPKTDYAKTPGENLAAFEQALNSFVQAWSKYQPDDSLAKERKQDLEWLKLTLRDYRLNIHTSSKSRKFWQGCIDGKCSRRTLSEQNSQSVGQTLLRIFTSNKAQKVYELGVQVGWRYARLKNYLLRIRKQRKLEQAQQLQDYQQFFDMIRCQQTADSVLSFGSIQAKKSQL